MAIKRITIQDTCDKDSSKYNDNEFLINMSDFYREEYEDILKYLWPITIEKDWKKIDVTILDIFNIPIEKDEEIIKLIHERTKIDITSKKWIEKINEIFNIAKSFYENRYLRRLPTKIEQIKFKDTKDIIDFLKKTKTQKRKWLINCIIAKISYVVSEIINNETIKRKDFLDEVFIEKYIKWPFQIRNIYEKNWVKIIVWIVNLNNKSIKFKMTSRQKWFYSIIWKQIADPKYYSTEEFKDLVWLTIYVESEEDAIELMQYIDQVVYNWEAQINNKGGVQKESIENCFLNEEFLQKIEKSINNNDKKDITRDWYKEIKLTWIVKLPKEWNADFITVKKSKYPSESPIWTEIKFVINWHDNEKWLSLHAIYNYLKRFRELTRLWIPIRKLDIINYVNDFFENIDDILEKNNKNKNDYYNELLNELKKGWFIEEDKKLTPNNNILNEKILALWLYKYFESKLKTVKKWKKSKIFFFADERALLLSDIWLHTLIEKKDKNEKIKK